MFERFTDKARRSIFFARYEATQYQSATIEAEHLLLAILREDKAVAAFIHRRATGRRDDIRRKIEEHTRSRSLKKSSTSVEVHLSQECHRILKKAAAEADRLGDPHIGTEYLFQALLSEQGCSAATLLQEMGVKAADFRGELERGTIGQGVRPLPAVLEDFVQAWIDRDLELFIGFFHDDSLLIDERGNRLEGRAPIAAYCAGIRGGTNSVNTSRVTLGEIRYLQDRIAIVPLDWEFANPVAGQPPLLVRSLLIMRNQDGEWLIAAAQLTEVRSTGADSNVLEKPAES